MSDNKEAAAELRKYSGWVPPKSEEPKKPERRNRNTDEVKD